MQPIETEISVKIFISYARSDRELCRKLEDHLSPLKNSGKISIWQDQEIPVGKNWEDQINTSLNEANIILLLVSSSFVASKYCWSKEVKVALQRHEAGTAQVIPIILKPVNWQDTPLGQLQALPAEAKPVTQWDDQEAALENVARGIRKVVDDLLTPQGTSRNALSSSLQERRPGRRLSLLLGWTLGFISLLVVLFLIFRPILFTQLLGERGLTPLPTMRTSTTLATAQNLYNQIINKPPTISDSLVDNSQGYQWQEVNSPGEGGFCKFDAGAYRVSEIKTNKFFRCTATKAYYGDFVYQIEATIFKGDQAGVIFRFNRSLATFYSFYIGVDGAYMLSTNDSSGFLSSLTSNQSPLIRTGYNQPNVITIIAQGSNILIYVNKQFLTSVNDTTYSQGSIGVAAEDLGVPTEVGFSNMKLWQL